MSHHKKIGRGLTEETKSRRVILDNDAKDTGAKWVRIREK